MALGEFPLISFLAGPANFTSLPAKSWPMAWTQWLNGKLMPKPNKRKSKRSSVKLKTALRKWPALGGIGGLLASLRAMLTMSCDVFPAFGHKFIDTVTAAEIRELMLAVEERGARDVAKRAHETTSQIFRYAIARGIASRNPAADFKPSDILSKGSSVNFARVDAKDLPRLLEKMYGYDGHALTRLAMRLLACTFVRTSELIESEWLEFDLENSRWDIPAERMKMDTPHIVPLSRQAVEVLRALKLLTGQGKFLFPGANDKNRPMSNNTILFALYRLGYKGRMTGHGFRGLASTILHENDFAEEHIELQLAHQKRNKVAAAYNHAKYLSKRAAMMQWWADYLDAQLDQAEKSNRNLGLKRTTIPARTSTWRRTAKSGDRS
jgi:integrase